MAEVTDIKADDSVIILSSWKYFTFKSKDEMMAIGTISLVDVSFRLRRA